MKFNTKAVHCGSNPDSSTGAVMPPIFQSSTFVQTAPGVHQGYDYTRAGNPNFTDLEKLLASLEGASEATVFNSGISATNALLSRLRTGDRVVASRGLYGGTFRLFTRIYEKFGIRFEFVSPDGFEEALKKRPKLVYIETPTNPLMEIIDIERVCSLAKEQGALTVVDNTFATPYFQSPLVLGADAVLHSTTKYIGGHSDVVGGVIMTSLEELKAELDFIRMAAGFNPAPFDTWLTQRGAKTLGLRMEKHHQNAQKLVEVFQKEKKVKRIYYPWLEEHPGSAIARRQMRGCSGVFSVEFALDTEKMKEMISRYRYFTLAESLGGVESLVCHPTTMIHGSLTEEERQAMGITPGLVRYSTGIEDVEDLIEDLCGVLGSVLKR